MKIVHITTARVLYGGQRRQLEFESKAASTYGFDWTTIALQTEAEQNDFESRIPRLLRSRVLLRLYGWWTAIRLGRTHDIVLLRDMQLDLFGPVLGLFVKNRITVHHAKETEELAILRGGGLGSRVAVFLEKYVKPLTMRSALGLAGVTDEIRTYELTRFPWLKQTSLVIPNGCLFEEIPELERATESGTISCAFVCAEFAEWHGLDRLLDAIQVAEVPTGTVVRFHLVGQLTEAQATAVDGCATDRIEIVRHGRIPAEDVTPILAGCDLAIGSLALDRQGLREGSTLKVREYLASGLPVYATHSDAALPASFAYFRNDRAGVSVERLIQFFRDVGTASRHEIREASRPHLDKGEIMRSAIHALEVILRS